MSRLTQLARSAGLDGNPMRRRTDRVEALVRITVCLVLLVVTPVITWLIGREAYQDGVRIEREERARRHNVEAVLLQEATTSPSAPTAEPTVLATASWTVPGGEDTRTGWVPAKAGTTAGATIPVWVDSSGLPTSAPRPHDETVAQTAAIVVLVPLVTILIAIAAQLGIRAALDRHRLRQWQAAWLRVEPLWSGRRT